MAQKVNPNIFRIGKIKEWDSKYFEKKSNEQYLYAFKDIEIKNFIGRFFKNNGLIVSNSKLYYSGSTLHIFVSYYLISNFNFLTNKILIRKPYKRYHKKLKHTQWLFNYKKLNKNKILKSKKLPKIKFLKYSNIYLKKKHKNIKNFKINSFIENFTKSLNNFINKKEIKIIVTFKHLNKNIKLNFNKKKLRFIQEKLSELRLFEKTLFFNEGLNIIFTFIENNESPELLATFIADQLKQLKKNHSFFLKFIKATLTTLLNSNKRFNSNINGIKIKIKGKFNKSARARHQIISLGRLPVLTLTSNTHYSEKISYSSNGTFGVKIWTYNKFIKTC